MQEVRLTPTSYIVLGLLELRGRVHAVRAQAAGRRLGRATSGRSSTPSSTPSPSGSPRPGYVTEKRERGGRRRKLYEITDKGREALDEWRTRAHRPRSPSCASPPCSSCSSAPTRPTSRAVQLPAHRAQARRVRGDPRRDAGRRAATGRGSRSRPASVNERTASGSGRSSRARVRARWPPQPSHGRPSCRSRAAATGAKVRLHPLLTGHDPGPAGMVPARGGPDGLAQGASGSACRRTSGSRRRSSASSSSTRAPARS